MIDSRKNCVIYAELKNDAEKLNYWFDYTQKKFLHNIDTFYYSVKLDGNFTKNSKDFEVLQFRHYIDKLDPGVVDYNIPVDFGQSCQLNYIPLSFAGFYDVCFECPEYYDIFMSTQVPASMSDADESVTSEIIVQIRSCLLWELGVVKAFEQSFDCVKKICEFFKFTIADVKENRIDYCWHTNYLQNPETYFRIDKMTEMCITRLGRSNNDRGCRINYEYAMQPGKSYENDYISLGKRSQKCFLRIYLKSKEVIQMQYKPWFLKVWLFHKMINRYDFFVYEELYKYGKWQYLDVCRLKFYLEYGADENYKREINLLINTDRIDFERVEYLADLLTPPVHLIINVEYQTTRKHSKNYILLPLHDNNKYGVAKRIYSYFDNHSLITEYLTHEVFRLIDTSDVQSNRSRADYNAFWSALRRTKLVDVAIPHADLALYRDYSSNMSGDMVKKRAANAIVTHSLYRNGLNDRSVIDDAIDFIVRLNDNDMHDMLNYKSKKSRLLNSTEIGKKVVPPDCQSGRYTIIDNFTGEILISGGVADED